MDSTDAYAGTFLLACLETYRISGNISALEEIHLGISLAVTAIEATQCADGLTWALPTYHVKYLMDLAETYGGLIAAKTMALALNDWDLFRRAENDSQRMWIGVQALWNETDHSFNPVYGDGAEQVTDWTVLYPDAVSEAWAVGFGLANLTQSIQIVERFLSIHPQWDEPFANDTFVNGSGDYVNSTVGYWIQSGFALLFLNIVGNLNSMNITSNINGSSLSINLSEYAFQASMSIREAAISVNRAWPYTPADSGALIMLETADFPNENFPIFSTTTTTITTSSSISMMSILSYTVVSASILNIHLGYIILYY